MGGRRDLSRQQARLVACWCRLAARPPAGDGRERLGRFTLRPAQVDAAARVRSAIDAFGGALLADPPGAGKTIVALAVARDAPDAMVIAPAALRAQWVRSATRAGMPLRFTSFEALSREARPSVARGALVIVDEAHHARTPGTRRYARLAELCTGAGVLLLSATPVVNRAADRDALLGLFLRPDSARGDAIGRCVIRRDEVRESLPAVRRLPPLRLPASDADAGIGRMLRDLPPPLPAADGTAALALIRITLAMAWSSSLAALDAALRRRLQRGETLLDSLAAGAWPSRATLRQWVVGDDATQLAFPELERATRTPPADGMVLLCAHLDAVRALRSVVSPAVANDTARRAEMIEALQGSRPAQRVVVFARHAETVRALWSTMRSAGGVIAIAGERVLAAQGRWRRDEVLAALGPRAGPLRADDARMIRILLTTDLLSEGVELQGVGTVVHADRAWTSATMEQREGRVIRPMPTTESAGAAGACQRVIYVTRFEGSEAATPLLRLGRRLAKKEREGRLAVRDAECRAAVDRAFDAWRAIRGTADRRDPPCSAFIAAIRLTRSEERIVAGEQDDGRWRITESPCAIARVAAAPFADPCRGSGYDLHDATTIAIRRALACWARRQVTRRLLGTGRTGRTNGPRSHGPWPRLRGMVDRILRGSTLAGRAARGEALARSVAILERWGGAGVERGLREFLRDTASTHVDARAFESRLHALAQSVRRDIPRCDALETSGGVDHPPGTSRPRLLALVLLAPESARPLSSAPAPQRRASAPLRPPSASR